MGWAVGERRGRHIGYGVPATCDYPGCGAAIDRGLEYACGGGVTGDVENCGLFFCSEHLHLPAEGDSYEYLCERCLNEEPPFTPTPDVPEWVNHVLTDSSWSQWREENPRRVAYMRKLL